MSFITKEAWQKNGVELITFNEENWLTEKHIKGQLKHSNSPHITRQYSLELRK